MLASISESTVLSNGVKMPWLGLGVFKMQEGSEVEQAAGEALRLGYRSIDTAALYGNERGVGRAIKDSEVPRKEIFVTTKVWNSDQGYRNTLRAFEESLRRLDTGYIDLYLIHWPVAGRFGETWRALEELYRGDKVKAIGVSNFLIHHLEDLFRGCKIRPMVNQVEFHPFLVQPELLKFCSANDIQVEAWSPLMQGRALEDSTIKRIARKYGKTPAQVILRWDLQHSVVTIPKTVHGQRIKENMQIFDFELSQDDLEALDSLDSGTRAGPDPDNFDF